jgi:hypothetical protein
MLPATTITPTWSPPSFDSNLPNDLQRSKSKKKKKTKAIHELDPQELDMAAKLAVLSITAMLEKRSRSKVQLFALKTFQKMVGKKEEKHPDMRTFGVDLGELVERTGVMSKWSHGTIPLALFKMLEAFEKEEILKTEGLFRVSGNQGRINKLKDQFDISGDVDLSNVTGADLSGLIKLFFKELPDSLFTSELYKSYISISSLTNKRVQIENLQYLSILLPKENRDLAACLLKFLSNVTVHKDDNKMDARNVALVLAPTLFGDRRKKSGQNEADKEVQKQAKIAEVLQVMIECQSVLFLVPVDLLDQLEYTQSTKQEKQKKNKWFSTFTNNSI